jgi:hypothetical protein
VVRDRTVGLFNRLRDTAPWVFSWSSRQWGWPATQTLSSAGGHLQALAEPTAEATIALAMSFLVGWLARRWNHQGTLARSLGCTSFAAYIIHPPVLVLLSVGLSSVYDEIREPSMRMSTAEGLFGAS